MIKQHWRLWLVFGLLLLIPQVIGNIFGAIVGINKYTLVLQTVAMTDIFLVTPVYALLSLFGILISIPFIVFVYRWYEQHPVLSVKELFHDVKPRFTSVVVTALVHALAIFVFILIIGTILSILLSLFIPTGVLEANFNNLITVLYGIASVLFVYVYQAVVIKKKRGVQAVSDSVSTLRRMGWKPFAAVLLVGAVAYGVERAFSVFSDTVILFLSERVIGSLTQFNIATAFLSLPFQYGVILVTLWATVVVTLMYAFFADPPVHTSDTE